MQQEKLHTFFFRVPLPIKGRLILLASLAVLTLGTSTWSIYHILTADVSGPLPSEIYESEIKSKAKVASVPEFTFPYELKPLTIALSDRKKLRSAYAQFALVFDCPSEESRARMALNRAKLMNTVNEVAGQFVLDDFAASTGFATFKGALQANYKTLFGKDAPRQIAVKDWVMQ